jgi:hypothetical protein
MFYGIFPETGSDSPLRHRLKIADLVDPGTGATFEALEKRGYILCRYKPVVGGDPLVYVQITHQKDENWYALLQATSARNRYHIE